MYSKIKELRQQRAKLWKQAKDLHDKAEAENRALSAEEQERWDKLMIQIDELKERIDRAERSLELESEMAQIDEPIAGRRGGQEQRVGESEEYRQTFVSYLRYGRNELSHEERAVFDPHYAGPESRALGTTSTEVGGALVASQFYTRLTMAMQTIGGVRPNGATVLRTTTGANLTFPLANDTEEGEQIGENEEVTEQDTPFGVRSLGAYIFTSRMIRLPFTLVQDSAFDIEAYLIRVLGKRLGRITNRRLTLGNGTTQPQGLVLAAPVGATGPLEPDTLIDLEHSIDPAHRMGARWQFHDNILRDLKKMKDNDGNPLWLPGVAVREPDRILGYEYGLNQHMPTVAGEKTIVFGRMSAYYIRDVTDMRILRLVERYADRLQIAYLGYLRMDGGLIEAGDNPIKALRLAATP